MRFSVSSLPFSAGLQATGKVITGKTTTPILDNFLITAKDGKLTITASNEETTLRSPIETIDIAEEGSITIPARLIIDATKELPDQPLEISSDSETGLVEIKWLTGMSQIPFESAEDYPEIPGIDSTHNIISIPASNLSDALSRTHYATGEETIHQTLTGICFDLTPESLTVVATDAQKLAYSTRYDIHSQENSSFILPKAPAVLLKNLLPKNDEPVNISYDRRFAFFEFGDTLLVARLIEGTFPAYRSIIPKNNNNHIIINRLDLLQSIKRVAVCSNPATKLIKVSLETNLVHLSAKDPDLSLSANEKVKCQYEGEMLQLGLDGNFMINILNNMPYEDICIQIADPRKAILIVAAYPGETVEETAALLMPKALL